MKEPDLQRTINADALPLLRSSPAVPAEPSRFVPAPRLIDAQTPPEELYDPDVLNAPTVDALIGRLQEYLPEAEVTPIRKAYAVAFAAHHGQKRKSGEDYINHPVATAAILIDMQMDVSTITAALLHDVVEDSAVTLEQIEALFGKTVARLVDGVTKLSVLEMQSKEEAQIGSYRKMFIAMADDPRVVLIKLADRLHNMRTIEATPPHKQVRIAQETMDIYAPLAHRLGIWQIKSELEDLSFKVLNPQKYREISFHLSVRREVRERIVQRVISRLKQALEKEGISGAKITGRPKHIYSIFRKMERKGVPLEQIYDQLAVRVIVNEVSECYRVLGIVHTMWTPMLAEFDDYIAVPKESMYRSLHTTVLTPGGTPCEVQIRTQEMHEVAERGIAAHWRYKEGFRESGKNIDKSFEAKLAWLRQLLEWRYELTDAHEFLDHLKTDFLEDQVYVFTPKGEIIDLPDGSTPVDFAYRIHSEVGNRCIGARVNGAQVPLDHRLKNGDVVSIMKSKSERGPSRDWLNFVKSASARNHIKRYYRRLERTENITAGRTLLEKELKRLVLTIAFDDIVSANALRSVEELFLAIGTGEITARQAVQKAAALLKSSADDLSQIPETTNTPRHPALPNPTQTANIQVLGTTNLMTRLARCCNPVQGDHIMGYITRGRGITIHRANCHTILNEKERERLVEANWNVPEQDSWIVAVRVESWDRVGLWRDVSAVVADAGINIVELQQIPSPDNQRAVFVMHLRISTLDQLTRLLDKLHRIPNVIEASRDTRTYPPVRRPS